MKKAQFTEADIAAAVAEFEIYMAPRIVAAGGNNGDIKVYGENSNARKFKPIIFDDEDQSGIL